MILSHGLLGADNLFTNPGFEAPLEGWGNLWTREADTGQANLDNTLAHSGDRSLKVQHTGSQDWSLQFGSQLDVSEGDRFEFNGWVHVAGPGSTEFCVVTYDSQGQVMDWSYGTARNTTDSGWQTVKSSFFVGQNVARIQPRLIGYGQATVHWDDVSFMKTGNVFDQVGRPANQVYTLNNEWLTVDLQSQPFGLTVTDKRCDKIWQQQSLGSNHFVLQVQQGKDVTLSILDGATNQAFQATLSLDPNQPELSVTVTGQGSLDDPLDFPPAFTSKSDMRLILPINEGIAPDVDDTEFDTGTYVAYGGHGICMAFWGVTQGNIGHMAILETPDDAAIQVQRLDGLLQVQPSWHAQKGQFGTTRKLRYVFFNEGGYVAMCQRYRKAMEAAGRVRTLAQKRIANPHVDRLIGAVNVWNWDSDPVTQVRDMQALGIEHILWSRRSSPAQIKTLNQQSGVLTSRYDIYQDLMDPDIVTTQLGWTHTDWTQAGWPQDLMIDAHGNWVKGWEVKGKDGKMYPCGTLCDRQAPAYARQRVSEELTDHDYRCRFIDTTTASPWRECYDPDHPMTRSDSRHWKMELLRLMSEEMKLVTGSETGHDAAVPYVHYFEGMMSLGPFRVPDAGRNMVQLWNDVPNRVATYQMGHRLRLPLWELVYHDCVVAQWYWGDYNNKLPSLWDKRDLFNLLYGTPPMFMFNKAIWTQYRDRFAQSYRTVCPTVREVGYSRMKNHQYLAENRDVQQTTFANGTEIIVNFGATPYRCDDGQQLAPLASKVLH